MTQKVTVDDSDVANTRINGCRGLSSGSGTQDYLAKWSPTSGVLKNSTVFEDDVTGNIGVGTNNPSSTSKMEVSKSNSDSILSIQAGAPGNSAPQSILRLYGEYGNWGDSAQEKD